MALPAGEGASTAANPAMQPQPMPIPFGMLFLCLIEQLHQLMYTIL